ncbi:hypothetical protein Dda_2546 [Drechslerella dactyloides]|uniref:Biogenesis of lysosome-related organelles complex 1 subunit 7 n=1 Tax=Drechslerella dactyloides TaxID=74499 RepID=A0AAD6J446_DREDA|nr:hypothetical protein Dda_2546 [Drechslerella dactyloides]
MSTTTSLAGTPPSLSGHVSPSPPRDPLASGLRGLFDPTIRQTTEKLWMVHRSQMALAEELERLISLFMFAVIELNHYLETTDPPALKPTIIKLANVGKRLNAVNTQLHQIQGRVNRLFIQLSKMRAAPAASSLSASGPVVASASAVTPGGIGSIKPSSPAAAALAAVVGVSAGSPSASGSGAGGNT